MNCSGYFGIGVERMKKEVNYGSLFRTAQIFEAAFIFLIGKRFKHQSSDTAKSWRHMPLYEYTDFEDFNNHRPYSGKLIGVELDHKATPIKEYKHPKQALYLLGAEDGGLSKEALKHCQDLMVLPGERSLNVSVCGSIVLYDRISKTNYPRICN